MTHATSLAAAWLAFVLTLGACRPPALTPRDGRLPVEGGTIFYRVIGGGEGIPVVLLHGGPGYTSHYLEPLAKALGNDRRVIVYDQLGSGRSDRVTDTTLLQIDRFVRELDSLRRALHLDRIHLYGHSWGSMLALEYLAAKPAGIASVTLASPVITSADWARDGQALLKTMPDSIQRIVAAHEAAGTTSSRQYQDASFAFMVRYMFGMEPPFPPEIDSAMAGYSPLVYETMWGPSEFSPAGSLKHFDRSAVLKGLRMPVLFTAGRHDEAVPATVQRFAQGVPTARVRIFEHSAHLAMVTERDTYADAVRAFLRAVEQSVQYRSAAGIEYWAQSDTGPVARAQAAWAADSTNVELLIRLGIAQSGFRQFREAIQTFSRGLATAPENAILYRWRGHRHLSVRELDRAEADFKRGLALDSANYGIWYHLGVLRFVRGDFAGAAAAFARAQPLAPDGGELAGATDWLWMSLARAGRRAEGDAMLQRRPDSLPVTNAYRQRLRLYRGEVGPDSVLTAADTGDVAVATLSYGVGNWYLVRGDSAQARRWFERAIASGGWPAFGFIAAEAELRRLR
jgi:proline iminopeptidase